MVRNKVVKRVTRKSYDKYSTVDYSVNTDNLNPVNPTSLENQFSSMVLTVKKRIISAYDRAKVEAPEDLFSADTTPIGLINDVDNLINKLKNNPLQDLYNNFNNLDALAPFVSSTEKADDIMNNPLKLDCSGIELTLLDTKDKILDNLQNSSDSSDNSNSSVAENDDDIDSRDSDLEDSEYTNVIQITYKGLDAAEDMSKYPTVAVESDFPLSLAVPSVLPSSDYVFKGWYLDEYYSSAIPNNNLKWPGKDITVYALIDVNVDDFENTIDTTPTETANTDMDESNDCELIELAFLKIILIVIIVIKTLITVLVLVLNIMKAAADIAKDAQLCWINPPSLQSLISYVMQRLSAVIFQIVGMIFLKLWGMLNLDCISENTTNTIDQINQALAGMTDMLGQIDALAINFNNTRNNDLWKELKETIKNLRDQILDQGSKIWDSIGDIGEQFKAAGEDIADTYTNPATYISAVPAEIRNKVLSAVDQYTETLNNVKKLKATIVNSKSKNSNQTNDQTPKGIEILPL